MITYPLLLQASSVLTSYSCGREYYFVVDQEGVIRYRSTGALYARYDSAAIVSTITQLLAQNAVEQDEDPTVVPSRLSLGAPRPSVARYGVRFDLSLAPDAEPAVAVVRGPTGRRVRILLANVTTSAAPARLAWDLRDDEGRSVPSGVYVLELRQGERAVRRRVVVVR